MLLFNYFMKPLDFCSFILWPFTFWTPYFLIFIVPKYFGLVYSNLYIHERSILLKSIFVIFPHMVAYGDLCDFVIFPHVVAYGDLYDFVIFPHVDVYGDLCDFEGFFPHGLYDFLSIFCLCNFEVLWWPSVIFSSRVVCILFLSWASAISLSKNLCDLVILLFFFIVTPHRYFSWDLPDLSLQFLNSRSLPFAELSLISACLRFPSAAILPQHVCLRAWLPFAAFDLCVSDVGDCLQSFL